MRGWLTVPRRLALVAGAPLVLLAGAGSWALRGLGDSSREQHEAFRWSGHATRVLRVQSEVDQTLFHLADFLDSGEARDLATAQAARRRAEARMRESARAARAFSEEEEDEERAMQQAFAELMGAIDRAVQVRGREGTVAAHRLWRREIVPLRNERLVPAIGQRIREETAGAKRSAASAREALWRTTRLLAGAFAGALLLGALAAWFSAGTLRRQTRALSDGVRRIGRGDLQAPVPALSSDELGQLANAVTAMMRELAEARRVAVTQQRIEAELAIGARLQAALLPPAPQLRGFEVAACMEPATEVGGDYYDVIPSTDGGWLAIGDVSGHGLPAGIEMLIVHGVIAAKVNGARETSPASLLVAANEVLYESIGRRLGRTDFVTLTLLHCRADGAVTYAGAHQDMLVGRVDGSTEVIPTAGTWLGVVETIAEHTPERAFHLAPGDRLVLYTDGVTEARNAEGEMFGLERLRALLSTASPDEPVAVTRDRMLQAVQAWAIERDDDRTLVVVRASP